jgi:hypothetical protein
MRHVALISAFVVALVGLATGSRNAEAGFGSHDQDDRAVRPVAHRRHRASFGGGDAKSGRDRSHRNRSGAGGIIGSGPSRRPDGYTPDDDGIAYRKQAVQLRASPYDPLQSFTPVMGLIETNGIILVARKDIPADNISALNAFAKRGRMA